MSYPDSESPFENNMLEGSVVIDAWSVLRSTLTPEHYIDLQLAILKKDMLDKFYQRFPGQRSAGD